MTTCPEWFHPSSQCMGISEASIAAKVREGDGGCLRYVCTKCRVESQSGQSGCVGSGQDGGAALDKAALSQLFITVCNLASSVATLVQQVSGFTQRLDDLTSSNVTQDFCKAIVLGNSVHVAPPCSARELYSPSTQVTMHPKSF